MTTDPRPDLMRYIDGTMPADEVRALEEKLRQDGGLRKELLILAGFEADLPGALAAVAQEKRVAVRVNTATFSSAPPAASRTARSEARRPAAFHRVFWPVAAAASLLLAAGIYLQAKRTSVPRPQPSVAAGQPAKTTTPAPAPRAPAEGRLVAVSGDVRVARTDGTGQPAAAAVGAEVFAGETILTATNASAQFAYADGSTLRIYRGSAVVLSRTDAGPGLDLRRGAVDADIRKQPAGRHLRVLGELMRAEIVGTEFRLMTDSRSKWKSLGVRTGVVEAIRVADGQKVVLQAGNYAAVATNWPYMRMDARVCPVWKEACRQMAGTPYP